jgi:hypothetical protein
LHEPNRLSQKSVYVKEPDAFLALFPHRFDYIYAEHPHPGQSPDWQTERRYPLADRVLLQGDLLYGVRFAAETQYCLLDIDMGSLYHPQRDALAISRILAALEPLGLVSHLACTSSYSGGLHLYFPFQKAQRSWEIAIALSASLETAGFKLAPGQLEVFPNPKPYGTEENLSLYNAHRLPMQAGSYLLNADFQPIWSDRDRFVTQWHQVEAHNDIDAVALRRILRQVKRRHYRISGKADKFLNDLNAEIELGWTGSGQTNYLLGRIAMRTYVFHSVLSAAEPLQGQALVDEIVRIAQALPGYQQWCRHQHEIEQRSAEWARCVEASRYYPYGRKAADVAEKTDPSENTAVLSWNQQQSENARERIRGAIAFHLDHDSLPASATARFRLLTQAGVGGSSLYRHRDLWHPDFLVADESSELLPLEEIAASTGMEALSAELSTIDISVDNPPYPPASFEERSMNCVRSAFIDTHPTSLLPAIGSNPLLHQCSSFAQYRDVLEIGRNFSIGSSDDCDLSDLLAAISVQVRRLAWTQLQIRDRLLTLFGKERRSRLSELELGQWLEWLEDYP